MEYFVFMFNGIIDYKCFSMVLPDMHFIKHGNNFDNKSKLDRIFVTIDHMIMNLLI